MPPRHVCSRLGALLALALLASACSAGAGVSTGPVALVEGSAAVAPVRAAIPLDRPSEQWEPRDSSEPAGGADAHVLPQQGSKPANAAVPDGPMAALRAEGARQVSPPASTVGADSAVANSGALAASQPAPGAPRRVSAAAPPPVTAGGAAALTRRGAAGAGWGGENAAIDSFGTAAVASGKP